MVGVGTIYEIHHPMDMEHHRRLALVRLLTVAWFPGKYEYKLRSFERSTMENV
jgi:hypothetical protein